MADEPDVAVTIEDVPLDEDPPPDGDNNDAERQHP